jgi:hypothetical protein
LVSEDAFLAALDGAFFDGVLAMVEIGRVVFVESRVSVELTCFMSTSDGDFLRERSKWLRTRRW